MNISILTPNLPYKRGFNDFFPLVKWRNNIAKEGIKIKFIRKLKLAKSNEILIIDYRFLQTFFPDRNVRESDDVINFVSALRDYYKKLILFDTGDGTSSRAFWLTPHVDLHIKKQILKNKFDYIENNGDKSVMPWIPDCATPSNIPYKALDISQIQKIKLGWNIGMLDYRYFPLKKYLPIGTTNLFNVWHKELPFVAPDKDRLFLTSYRGSISNDTRYSFQRSATIKFLNNLKLRNLRVATGSQVSLKRFIKELQSSHVAISPFGWGEVCYRDFESIIYGNILIKPDMSHLETYPNIFLPMESYVPISWDMSDLPTIFDAIFQHLNSYKEIARNAQKIYRDLYHDDKKFINQFKKALEI
jgi:hypothetical protein